MGTGTGAGGTTAETDGPDEDGWSASGGGSGLDGAITRARPGGEASLGRVGRGLSGIAVVVGLVSLLGGFVFAVVEYQPFAVPTDSMSPTVLAGDRVIAQRIDGGEVRRGDMVVFNDTVWGDVPMLKRVVGVGGDTVACCDHQGRLTVNGKPVEEAYLGDARGVSPTRFDAKVPRNRLFLLGDNRATSVDSRTHLSDEQGTVPRSAVTARVDGTAWPFGRMGFTEPSATFSQIGEVSEPGPLRELVTAGVVGSLLIFGGAAAGPVAVRVTRWRRG